MQENGETIEELRKENEEYQYLFLTLQDQVSDLMNENEKLEDEHKDKLHIKEDQIDYLQERLADLTSKFEVQEKTEENLELSSKQLEIEFEQVRQALKQIEIIAKMPIKYPIITESVLSQFLEKAEFSDYVNAENERIKLLKELDQKDQELAQAELNISSLREVSVLSPKKGNNVFARPSISISDENEAVDDLKKELLEKEQTILEMEIEIENLKKQSKTIATCVATEDFGEEANFEADYTLIEREEGEIQRLKTNILEGNSQNIRLKSELEKLKDEYAGSNARLVELETSKMDEFQTEISQVRAKQQQLYDELAEKEKRISTLLNSNLNKDETVKIESLEALANSLEGENDDNEKRIKILREKCEKLEARLEEADESCEHREKTIHLYEKQVDELNCLVFLTEEEFGLPNEEVETWEQEFILFNTELNETKEFLLEKKDILSEFSTIEEESELEKAEIEFLNTKIKHLKEQIISMKNIEEYKTSEIENAENNYELKCVECDELASKYEGLQHEYEYYRNEELRSFEAIKLYYGENEEPLRDEITSLKKEILFSQKPNVCSQQAIMQDFEQQTSNSETERIARLERIVESLTKRTARQRKPECESTEPKHSCPNNRLTESLRSLVNNTSPMFESLSLNEDILFDERLPASARVYAGTQYIKLLKSVL